MPLNDLLIYVATVGGALVGLGVIWTKGLRPLYRFLRRVEDVHHLITEELPPFMANTVEWQTKADDVLKQLQPNSGSSMFDRVKRIEQQLAQQPTMQVNIDSGPHPRVETRATPEK